MNTASDQDFVNIDALKKAAMPDDFADLLSALFVSGFNYSLENRVLREVVNETILSGYRVDANGDPAGDYHVSARWEYIAGEWFFVAEKSGLVRTLRDGSLKLNQRDAFQLVHYVVGRINDWEFTELTEDVETDEQVLDDGVVEEDVIEEDVADAGPDSDLIDALKDSIKDAQAKAQKEQKEQPALPAPKRRGKKAS